MPAVDFDAMLAAADAIEAQERLHRIQDATVSSGWAKKATVSRHLAELERQSQRSLSADERLPDETISATTEASLSLAGVQVVRVDRDG